MLIECPECKGQVSDTASFCPHCGNTRLGVAHGAEQKTHHVSSFVKFERGVKEVEKSKSRYPKMMIWLGVPMSLLGLAIAVLSGGVALRLGGQGFGLIAFGGCTWCVVNLWRGRLYEAYRLCVVAAIMSMLSAFISNLDFMYGVIGAVVIECFMIPIAIALNRNEEIHKWESEKRQRSFVYKG